ncbi:MAG: ZIP family metal transporter [Chloroflexi bacterium]|nr:ZIP family metal transporter [Chloroflexota bacterium]
MPPMLLALLLGLLTTVANVLGGYLAVAQRAEHPILMRALIGISGGFILGVALLELIPEALEGGALIPPVIVTGYLVMYLLEQYFAAHAHEPEEPVPVPVRNGPGAEHTLHAEFRHTPRAMTPQAAIAAFVGFMLHDFLDGIAIGAGFVAGTALGVLIFLGVLLHEVPAGISVATIMRAGGWGRRAAFLSGVGIGLITLPAIALPFLLGGIQGPLYYAFLALPAGTFLYIATGILIPTAGAGGSRTVGFSVVLGFFLFWASSFLVQGAFP